MSHEKLETKVGLMGMLLAVPISIRGAARWTGGLSAFHPPVWPHGPGPAPVRRPALDSPRPGARGWAPRNSKPTSA